MATRVQWGWALVLMASTLIVLAVLPQRARAQEKEELRQRIKTMEQQLKEIEQRLATTEQQAAEAKKEATAEDNAAINFHITGYGSAGYTHNSGDDPADSFDDVQFSPIFLVGYKDLLLFESEVEISVQSDGDTKVELEFANLNLIATDWLMISAGKFLSPIGDFQQHQHPSWINKLPDRPAGFVEDGGVEPLNEVGVMARGAFPVGSMSADYAVYVGNGPRLSDEASEAVLHEGFGGDINDYKAFGGRIGLHPLPYVTVGFSGMYTRVKGNEGSSGAVSQAGYDLQAVDAAVSKGSFDMRGEFIRGHLGSLMTAFDSGTPTSTIPKTTWYAWYAQTSYKLAGVSDTRFIRNLEPVVRFSQFKVSGFDEFEVNEERRWTAGMDYWFTPSLVVKAAYERRNFAHMQDEDVARVQIAFGF